MHEEDIHVNKVLVGKPEETRPLKKMGIYIWEENIKTDLKKIWWDGVEWIDLAQDRDQWQALVNMVMDVQVQQKAGNCLSE
jgi:hypothetical protein